MGLDDNRQYLTFFAIETNDWKVNFGTFSDHHKLLVRDYINEACSTVTSSAATNEHKFIYPHHIKKKYFIEGIIEGHITFAASECTAELTKYRVTLCKENINPAVGESELFSTEWITVNDTFEWNAVYSAGQEIVYPFFIDAWEAKEVGEYDRLFVKIETDISTCTTSSCSCCVLWHSNDSTWEDFKIIIPIRG